MHGMANNSKNDNGQLVAILSYLLIGIIWYFVDAQQRKDGFVQFHVRQSVAILIVSVAVWIVSIILAFIPVIGWLAGMLLSLGVLVLWLIGLIGACTNKKNDVPLASAIAKNFTF
jgi:uncharacterized membrane protein